METIPLQNIPNQEFSIQLGDNFFNIGVYTTGTQVSVSLAVNGVQMVMNMRAVAGGYIIPSKYQEAGNFMFITQNFELPNYTKFGVTQSLVYVTAADLAVFRAAVTPPITEDDFNPIADPPLRFKPQGYTLAP